MGNSEPEVEVEDPEITLAKIENLEASVKTFIQNQEKNIKDIFNNKDYSKRIIKINYSINDNDFIQNSPNELEYLYDYAIQWSIQGINNANTTNCHLTLFNIGALLGKDGFLYSICLFYYYFMKIPIDRKEKEIYKDIQNCLEFINKNEKDELNDIWRVYLTDDDLNCLRIAKDFLINLFQEEITNDIFSKINSSILHKIWGTCKSFGKGVAKYCCIIFYFLSCQLSEKEKEKKINKEKEINYIKRKNRINKFNLPNQILQNLNLDFFQKYNIFILASDDNTTPFKNYGITFMGDHIKGLGEFHRARRLIISSKDLNNNDLNENNNLDGFILENSDSNNKKIFDFYTQTIKDLKLFLDRNKDRIENIKKGINIEQNIQGISKEIDLVNNSHIKEGVIDTEKMETRRTTIKEDNLNINNENFIQQPLTIFDHIKKEMGEARAIEAKNIMQKLGQESHTGNYAQIRNQQGNTNINNNNISYSNEKQQLLIDN